ncbi:uncharacterized protein LOC117736452 [Cyclopterus lumpus]|uniref:uncharacterized protein LOC117736452 n=1 Tax=Cyclopterus lumpus TaxID=8103 RepID=UPI00148660F1|nr:uncharacterized protein LOC117736452 [Cyclopterus lumpus]XP_034397699.1 uncharacterized protein LOC117736452 [Cyclopterus lumpus]
MNPVTAAPRPPRWQRLLRRKKKGRNQKVLWFRKKNGSPQRKICPINPRNSFKTVVLPSSSSKMRRVYDRRNYCLFCTNPESKMSRHLERIHSDKPEVAAVFQHPKRSRERYKIWNRLINQGNFLHNKEVLKTGKGLLVSRKRPNKTHKAQDFLHCLYCRGFFMKNSLSKHMKSCPEKVGKETEAEIGRKRLGLRCVLETLDDLGISDGFKDVMSPMKFDDVTQAIMADGIILQYGEDLFDQYGSNPKKHDYIRQNLRQIARLVLEAQNTTPLEKLEDFFLPSNFPHVVCAVNVLAGYNPETKTYALPSLALKLGYNLQKTCGIVEGNATRRGDAPVAEAARSFLAVYQEKWNALVSAGALTTIRETKLNKEEKVPFAQDVKRLISHMEDVHLVAEKNLRDATSAENYAALAKVILVRTILFNRRSVAEISSLEEAAFMSRIKSSDAQYGMDVSVSDLERSMCEFFTRVDIRGKSGRIVPVLLKPSFVSALELLVNVRETCGVPRQNPFVFGRPHTLSAYRGSVCIQRFVRECGAKDPAGLTATKIRRHYGTMLQLINLDENETAQILGPNNQGPNNQGPNNQDPNNQGQSPRQDSGMRLDDVEMEPDERHRGQAHRATRDANKTAPPKSGTEGSKYKTKHKWGEAEVLAVERHMKHFIKEHRVPQKNDCIQCLDAEPKALRSRSWKGVKDYVRNRITALKRRSGNPKARS